MESTTSMGQTQKPTTYESKMPSKTSETGVFLMRAEGQSFEEFKEFCVKRFREAGLIKD